MPQNLPEFPVLKSKKVRLTFRQPAQTSRNTLLHRDVWILHMGELQSECAPLPGLSPDWLSEQDWENALGRAVEEFNTKISAATLNFESEEIESWLDQWRINYPSIAFGLENMQQKIQGLYHHHNQESKSTQGKSSEFHSLLSGNALRINGLIWMNDLTTMRQEALNKVAQGFKCLKFKIGALDWAAELDLIREIRGLYPPEVLEIRVDANGALNPDLAITQLKELQDLDVHSIEQPFHPRFNHYLASFTPKTSLPIALDESILLCKPDEASRQWIGESGVKYLVLKPGLLGGFKVAEAWIQLAQDLGLGWWITSALESNIGLASIASWTLEQVQRWNNPLAQGLGTGALYTSNFPATTFIQEGQLKLIHS